MLLLNNSLLYKNMHTYTLFAYMSTQTYRSRNIFWQLVER